MAAPFSYGTAFLFGVGRVSLVKTVCSIEICEDPPHRVLAMRFGNERALGGFDNNRPSVQRPAPPLREGEADIDSDADPSWDIEVSSISHVSDAAAPSASSIFAVYCGT
jgi:hypothetical protein